ncbi:MAG: hypothetical protein NTZ95_00465 [Candidatus Omnitrophica bacterium]|nr:hypothetical protein [Candidatus Omnitrophota bacterium]
MRVFLAVVVIAAVAIAAAGCGNVSKPYVMKTDRVDQKLEEGNRGYLKGTPPPVGDRGDLKRPWIAVDVDLPETSGERSAVKVEKEPAEVKREVTVVKEETPTTVKTTTVVTEEDIK